jgi:D-glycero-D-manno-heptose 1,7-bisphosphate phosphatase
LTRTGTGNRFVFLDRDGTIIVEKHYLANPDEVELLPGAVDGLREMSSLGLGLIVVTNQSGVGLGYFNLDTVDAINRKLSVMLSAAGITLDGIYFCPHRPSDSCQCRKPLTGMIEEARKDLTFDPKKCFMIGDKPSDIEFGRNVGAVTFLTRTGYGASTDPAAPGQSVPDFVVADLNEAAQIIRSLLDDDCR